MKIAIVYTPEKIDPDIIDWVTSGWKGCPDDVIPFLKHLSAIRQGASLNVEGLIVIEKGCVLAPQFDKKITALINKIPQNYTTCLLSYYITDENNITYVQEGNKDLCVLNDNVKKSFAYWIKMTHAELLLSMFDKPLRSIPCFELTPECFSRSGCICFSQTPLVAYLDQQPYRDYFSRYGFNKEIC